MITRKLTVLTMKPEDDLQEFEQYQQLKKQGYFNRKQEKGQQKSNIFKLKSHEKFLQLSNNKPDYTTPPYKDPQIQINKYTPNNMMQ